MFQNTLNIFQLTTITPQTPFPELKKDSGKKPYAPRKPASDSRPAPYERLICNPLSDSAISTKRAFRLGASAAKIRRIRRAASGSLATIYR